MAQTPSGARKRPSPLTGLLLEVLGNLFELRVVEVQSRSVDGLQMHLAVLANTSIDRLAFGKRAASSSSGECATCEC